MMKTEEKMWRKPTLTVLLRSRPEEAVLTGCKGDSLLPSFLNHYAACHADTGCTTLCRDQGVS